MKAPKPHHFERAKLASKLAERRFEMNVQAKDGKAKVKTVVRKDGIHEMASVIADVSFATFMKAMNPADWSLNLPQRLGGEVRRVSTKKIGDKTEVWQQERMAVGFPFVLDMSKNTSVVIDQAKKRAEVRWQVTQSDKTIASLGVETVKKDDGVIKFEETRDGKLRITSRSVQDVDTLPALLVGSLGRSGAKVAKQLTAKSLGGFFRATVLRYKDIAEGKVEARALEETL